MTINEALKKIKLSEKDTRIAKKLYKGDKKESDWLKIIKKDFKVITITANRPTKKVSEPTDEVKKDTKNKK
jgi:hypothetical protein